MKQFAIIGILKNQYFVFEAWKSHAVDTNLVRAHATRLSENHPSISIWRCVEISSQITKGDSFSLTSYDKKVTNNLLVLLNSQYRGDWQEVNYIDLMEASKIARQGIEFGVNNKQNKR